MFTRGWGPQVFRSVDTMIDSSDPLDCVQDGVMPWEVKKYYKYRDEDDFRATRNKVYHVPRSIKKVLRQKEVQKLNWHKYITEGIRRMGAEEYFENNYQDFPFLNENPRESIYQDKLFFDREIKKFSEFEREDD